MPLCSHRLSAALFAFSGLPLILVCTLCNATESTLVEFRSTYGLASNGADDFKDWSENGIVNLLYCAFDLGDPNEALVDLEKLPSVHIDEAGYYLFSYRRLVEERVLDYSFEYNTGIEDLWKGTEVPVEEMRIVDETVTPLDTEYELHVLRIKSDVSEIFFRIEVGIEEAIDSPK